MYKILVADVNRTQYNTAVSRRRVLTVKQAGILYEAQLSGTVHVTKFGRGVHCACYRALQNFLSFTTTRVAVGTVAFIYFELS